MPGRTAASLSLNSTSLKSPGSMARERLMIGSITPGGEGAGIACSTTSDSFREGGGGNGGGGGEGPRGGGGAGGRGDGGDGGVRSWRCTCVASGANKSPINEAPSALKTSTRPRMAKPATITVGASRPMMRAGAVGSEVGGRSSGGGGSLMPSEAVPVSLVSVIDVADVVVPLMVSP